MLQKIVDQNMQKKNMHFSFWNFQLPNQYPAIIALDHVGLIKRV